MNDKNNLAKLMVSGDKANHEMAAIMLTNYTAIEFLEVLREVAKIYIDNMLPNIKMIGGGLLLAPALAFTFRMHDKRVFCCHFTSVNVYSVTIAAIELGDGLSFSDYDIKEANQVLGYLQQYYKQNEP